MLSRFTVRHLAHRTATPWLAGSIVCLLVCTVVAPGTGRASFFVSPMEVHLEIEAGRRGAAPLTISNTGKRPVTLKLYLSDSRFQRSGKEENLAPGEVERSCAPWVVLREEVLDLEPFEIRRVPVVIEVPPAAEGSYWTKLYIEEISNPTATGAQIEDKSYQLYLKQRMGIRIFEEVRGTLEPEARVTYVAVKQDSVSTPPRVLVSVDNPGNCLLRCTGSVEIRNSYGVAVDTLLVGTEGRFTLFPAMPRDLETTGDTVLNPGTYTALAIVDFGGDYLVAGDAVFRVDGQHERPGVVDD